MSELRFAVIADDLGLDASVVEKAFSYSETLLRHPIGRMHEYARSLVERGREEPDLPALDANKVAIIKTVRKMLVCLDVADALAVLKKAIDAEADSPQLAAYLTERAFIERCTHQSKAAAATLKKVVELTPTDPDAWFELGLAYAAASMNKRSAQPAFESGLAEARRLLDATPEDHRLRLRVAAFHTAIGDMRTNYAAMPHYRTAVAELAPFDEPRLAHDFAWNQALALAHYDVGRCLFERDKMEAALKSYEAAKVIADRAAQSGQPLRMEGKLLSAISPCFGYLGRHAEAIASAERGLSLRLAHGMEEGDLEEQIWAVRSLIKVATAFTGAKVFSEALIIYQKGCDAMKQLAAANPNYPQEEFTVPLWYGHVGDMYKRMGRFDEAKQSFKAGLLVARRLRKEFPDNDEFSDQEDFLKGQISLLQPSPPRTRTSTALH